MKSAKVVAGVLFIVFAAFVTGAYFFYSGRIVKKMTSLPVVEPKAFLNARWGMSKAEVEAANGVTLGLPVIKRQLFTPSSKVDTMRYQSYQQSEQIQFLGRKATVYYIFLTTNYSLMIYLLSGIRRGARWI